MSLLRGCALLLLVFAVAPAALALNYEITVENEIPGGVETGQPFSPPVAIVHGLEYMLWELGEPASPGLAMVAEEGATMTLEMEAGADPDVRSVTVGTGGPFFDSRTFEITAEPGDLLSIAWMLGRTNDLFSGIANVYLPASGSIEYQTSVYDAGSEMNTGMIAHIPFYGNSGVGPDEGGVVSMIDSYAVVDDPDQGRLEWAFPPAGRLRVRVLDPTPVAETSWSAVKALFR